MPADSGGEKMIPRAKQVSMPQSFACASDTVERKIKEHIEAAESYIGYHSWGRPDTPWIKTQREQLEIWEELLRYVKADGRCSGGR